MLRDYAITRALRDTRPFREQLIQETHKLYVTSTATRLGELGETQKFIRNFFEHLKADMAEAIICSEGKVIIEVSYEKQENFVEVKIQDMVLSFTRYPRKIEVWGHEVKGMDVLFHKLHTIKASCSEDDLEYWLRKVFQSVLTY
ncbi:hypothetical protein P9265_14970 [Schinkia azotoformans]|uniref:hypothetical protein n=1 Tax=Schinkia azotoformans TaxID=1454 RepID=UPI002E22816A|nr:hypothetical protein [Schinkia azotoformans]